MTLKKKKLLHNIVKQKLLTVTDFISWAPKSLQTVTAAMKLKDTCSSEKLWQT